MGRRDSRKRREGKGGKKENEIQKEGREKKERRERERQKERKERKRRICSLNFLFLKIALLLFCVIIVFFFSKPNDVTKAIYPRDDSPFQNIER